jgi:hypothetical protein
LDERTVDLMSVNSPNPAGLQGPIPELAVVARWRRCRRLLVLLLATLIAVPLAMRAESAGASDPPLVPPPVGVWPCGGASDCSPPPLLNLGVIPSAGVYGATPDQKQSLRSLEKQAIDNVIVDHGLSAGDTTAVQTWGRNEALAELFLLLLHAINAESPSADQKNAVAWLDGVVAKQPQSKAHVAAQAAGREYVNWAGLDEATYQSLMERSSTTESELTAFFGVNPQPWIAPHYATGYCAYRSPEPYQSEYTGYNNLNCDGSWGGSGNTCPSRFGCNPPTPSFEQFVRWGEAAASYNVLKSDDYATSAHRLGQATGVAVPVAFALGSAGFVPVHHQRLGNVVNKATAKAAAKAGSRMTLPGGGRSCVVACRGSRRGHHRDRRRCRRRDPRAHGDRCHRVARSAGRADHRVSYHRLLSEIAGGHVGRDNEPVLHVRRGDAARAAPRGL